MRQIMSTAVTCLSITAFSQTADAQVSGDSQTTEQLAIEEIVVTAQKREQRLQDVPISISVLGGDALDSSADRGVIEALGRAPGVFATVTSQGGRSGGNAVVAMRGASAATVGSNTVGYYIDSVPFARAQSSFVPDTNPYDLDRVEVLRGPQGTLYGASALNGVVRVLTKNPSLENFEFKSRASLSSTDHGSESYSGDAAFNMPLIQDKLAARVVLGYQELGGWIDKPARSEKDANDTEKANARVKLAAKPTDNFSVGVSGWFSRTDSGAPPFSDDGGRSTPTTVAEPSNTDFDSYSLDLGYDAAVVSIKSATSYLDYQQDNIFDFSYVTPGTIQAFASDSSVLTEELVLNSVDQGPWRWTLGSMYRDAQDNYDGGIDVTPASGIYHIESKSIAVFGELTRAFADGRFEVTGGVRYFKDDVRKWENSRDTEPTGIPAGGLLSFEDTFEKTTPRVVLTWHPGDDATVYASYSRGFRSGLAQEFPVAEAFPGVPSADPDTLSNYEIGGKASTLGGRLTFDAAVYYIDWQDVQQDVVVLLPSGPYPIFLNGESLSGPGFDLAMMYAPIDSLTLGLNVGMNDLQFDEAVTDAAGTVTFAKGSRRTNSPKTTAGASIDYTIPLGSYTGRVSAAGNYVSEQITGVNFAGTQAKADSMTLVRVTLGLEAAERWNASLFVDNATNEEGIQPDPNVPSGQTNTVIRPRTYGVQVEYRY